jgi:hypothetical protein
VTALERARQAQAAFLEAVEELHRELRDARGAAQANADLSKSIANQRDAALAANTRQRVELEAANAARISALAKDRAEAYQRRGRADCC